MDKTTKSALLEFFRKEREQHKENLHKLQTILRDLEYDGYGHIPKEVKKYVNKENVQKDVRLHVQIIGDLDCIIWGIQDEKSEVRIVGTIYEGNMYPELLQLLEKAGLKFSEETYTVLLD